MRGLQGRVLRVVGWIWGARVWACLTGAGFWGSYLEFTSFGEIIQRHGNLGAAVNSCSGIFVSVAHAGFGGFNLQFRDKENVTRQIKVQNFSHFSLLHGLDFLINTEVFWTARQLMAFSSLGFLCFCKIELCIQWWTFDILFAPWYTGSSHHSWATCCCTNSHEKLAAVRFRAGFVLLDSVGFVCVDTL